MTISDVAKRDMKNLAHALRTRMSRGSLPQLPAVDLDDPDEVTATVLRGDPTAAQPSRTEEIEPYPRLHEQGVTRIGGLSDGDSVVKAHFKRNWAAWVAGLMFIAPFGSIGDSEIYTGPTWLDVLKFLGILIGLWALGVFLVVVHLKRTRTRSRSGS